MVESFHDLENLLSDEVNSIKRLIEISRKEQRALQEDKWENLTVHIRKSQDLLQKVKLMEEERSSLFLRCQFLPAPRHGKAKTQRAARMVQCEVLYAHLKGLAIELQKFQEQNACLLKDKSTYFSYRPEFIQDFLLV